MIKLKYLIKESKLQNLDLSKSQSGIAFTTSKDMIKFNDPYEYKFVDGIWYTRKREGYGGDNTWIDIAKNLSAADATKAIDILLNKVYRVKTSDLKNKTDNTKSKLDKKVVTPDISSLAKDYMVQRDILYTLYDVITKNPQKYFKDFRSAFNDKEAEAAEYFKTNGQKHWIKELDMLKNKNNEDISMNTMLIKNLMDEIYKSIKNNSQLKRNIRIIDPTVKSTSTATKESGYTVPIWWQYFNN